MYPCLMVFASVHVLYVIQKIEVTKDLVNMLVPCDCTPQILRDSTVVCRQLLNGNLVYMLLNNV